jgi:hypothetical protein
LDTYPVNPDHTLIRPLNFHLFWDKLTALNFDECFVQPSEILLMLSRCNSLATFDFSLCVDFPEQHASTDHLPPVLIHPNLHSIAMRFRSPQPIGQFLRRIEFPHLKEFRLGSRLQMPENDWNQVFVPFVARSPHIRYISLMCYVPDSTASALLSVLPELLYARFSYLATQSTFERIVCGDTVPRLQTLSLAVDLFEPFLEVLEKTTSPNSGPSVLAKPGFRCIYFYLDCRDRDIWEYSERVTRLREEGRCGQIYLIYWSVFMASRLGWDMYWVTDNQQSYILLIMKRGRKKMLSNIMYDLCPRYKTIWYFGTIKARKGGKRNLRMTMCEPIL